MYNPQKRKPKTTKVEEKRLPRPEIETHIYWTKEKDGHKKATERQNI